MKERTSSPGSSPHLPGGWRPSESGLPGAGARGWTCRSGPAAGTPAKARPWADAQATGETQLHFKNIPFLHFKLESTGTYRLWGTVT